MIDINHYKEKEYMVNIGNDSGFTEDLANSLTREITPKLGEDRMFIINFKGIRNFSSKGFNTLFDLFKSANEKGAKILITNVEEEVNDLVETLTLSK
ncbi:MAG: STAS domain-containing protein [Bacteroidetes bacterium]|jgi:anti-anti-sigma regulatory factor|nr:STAS domain-containing protein [Bacteroidota bacterium]